MQQGYVLSVNNGLCSASRFHLPHLFDLWPYLSRKLYVRIKINYYFSYSSFRAEQNDMQQGYVWFINKTIIMFWTPIWPQFDLWPNLSRKLSWRVSFKYYFSYSSFQAEQYDMQGYVLTVNNGLCSGSRFHLPHLFDLWPYLSRKLYIRIKLNYYFSDSLFQAK